MTAQAPTNEDPRPPVWFGLLGPLDVRIDGEPIVIPAAKTRVLLAALLCRPNRAISADELIDTLWDSKPPDGAVITLRSHVLRLRRCLGPAADRIQTAAPGYRVRLDPNTELDSASFTELCHSARAAARLADWPTVAHKAATALALWRGTPLADVASERLLRDESAGWTQARAEIVELGARADLAMGRSAEAATALGQLAAEYPHRETAHALLMAALSAAGRRTEALEVFQRLAAALASDLGVEPGPEVRTLYQTILDADGSGTGAGTGTGPGARVDVFALWPRPQALPRDTADFTGRDEAVNLLVAELLGDPADAVGAAAAETAVAGAALAAGAPDESDPRPAPIAAIDGMGGVGKTALALRAAHRARPRFPDGQLYADLRGTGAVPADPGEVLGSFLRQLGLAADAVPSDTADRAALFRTLLAERRVLIVLDDARDAGQLAPLLPGTAAGAALVTARNRLIGLPGAVRLGLDGLVRAESRELLAKIVGARRIAAEPDAAEAVVTACADLPLAIRVAGGRLASRPAWRVADLAERLTAARNRLDELSYGGQDVRASFEIGYTGLAAAEGAPDGAARAFRLLGLWPGGDLGLPAAASLLGLPMADAERILEHLVDVHMLRSPRAGRYSLHDLLREFAAERAAQEEDAETVRTAAARLAGWAVHSMTAAERFLAPDHVFAIDEPLPGVTGIFAPESASEAVEWGETELVNLLDVQRLAAEHDLTGAVWQLPTAMWGLFRHLRLHEAWVQANEIALDKVTGRGDDAEAAVRNNLATALASAGREAEAVRHLEACVAIREAAGQFASAAKALNNLGIVAMQNGDPEAAIGYLRRGLELTEGDVNRARIHTNLGYLHLLLDQFDSSVAEGEAAEALHRAIGNRDAGFGSVLENLAEAHDKAGRTDRALIYAREGVDVRRETADRHGLVESLRGLAGIATRHGADAEARAALREADSLAAEAGD